MRVAVTGLGICSAIGNSVQEVLASMARAESGFSPFHGDGVEPMRSQIAAMNRSFQLDSRFPKHLTEYWDRGTQMAAQAACEAAASANIYECRKTGLRIGLAVGMSGSGQFTPKKNRAISIDELDSEVAQLLLRRNVPHFQLYQLARWLGVNGPTCCICSASAGSGIAIGSAMRWLQSNKVDIAIAGGGESIQLLNFLGFDTLGLLSDQPCSPFSESNGMTMGEGAAFVVIETLDHARQRGAHVHGELLGIGITSDAFDPIQFDPSGDGIRRAMQTAIDDAGTTPGQIQWVRASGAGAKAQDNSEVMALQSVFNHQVPPVSSTEPMFGHCNGAGPAMGLVASMAAVQEQWVPATLNFREPAYEGIDFVPNQPREHHVDQFLSVTAAFGGTNVVLLAGKGKEAPRSHANEDVVITGVGVVSRLGVGSSQFASEFDLSGSPTSTQFHNLPNSIGDGFAACIEDFNIRKVVPRIPSRGLDRLTQFACAAAHLALQESQADSERLSPEKLGIATGLRHTSGTLLEKLLSEIQGSWATPAMGRTLLNKGRFLVTSRLACWFGAKGYNATFSGGYGIGQIAFNNAVDQLKQSDAVDAIVVVAADEVSKISLLLEQRLGAVALPSQYMKPYDPASTGMTLGEGGVAIVIERRSSAERRGAKILAQIGYGSCSLDQVDRESFFSNRHNPMTDCVADSPELIELIRRATSGPYGQTCPDAILGMGLGIPFYDRREQHAVHSVFHENIPLGSLSQSVGVLRASGSLLNMSMAISAMQEPKATHLLRNLALLPKRDDVDRLVQSSLILASSEDGHNVVTFLQKNESSS